MYTVNNQLIISKSKIGCFKLLVCNKKYNDIST